MSKGFKVPVALFNFNRPHLTRRVFEAVRQIKPQRLLLVADGPRAHKPEDAGLCAEVRAVFDEIDWDCEVSRNFSDANMGSFKRNSSGLDWVFSTVEEAIILEDDCIPSLSFFPYCEELLERYRDDQRVGVISGTNIGIPEACRNNESYFFSAYAFIWGWASWRRVWQQVDMEMALWDAKADKEMLLRLLQDKRASGSWHAEFESLHNGSRKMAWDFQLQLACFRNGMSCVIPRVNLISNVGHGQEATNCTDELSPLQNIARHEMKLPLIHPPLVTRHVAIDRKIFRTLSPGLPGRLINRLKRIFRRKSDGAKLAQSL